MPDGIWGDTDSDEIPDNPFHIAENTYRCIVVECYEQQKDGVDTLIIKWQIDDPDSQYNEMTVSQKFTLYKKSVDQMTAREKQHTSFLKKCLREAFDLTAQEIKGFRPKMALGKYAFVHIVNTPDKNDTTTMYNNVRSTMSPRLMQEQQSEDSEVVADLLDV